MKYRIYIDEVGNSDLESSDDPNHRFLSLTGVIVNLEYVRNVLHPEVENLKTTFFDAHPDEQIILHRKELLNARYPFRKLIDPVIRDKFNKHLLAMLKTWNYNVISVCIDKKIHKETYTTWRFDPYHYCLAVLIERFVFFLEYESALGDVMTESRGAKEDKRLKDSFVRLFDTGTDFITPERIHGVLTSKQLKVKPKSANISGLQLADIIAHPSRSEILKESFDPNWRIAPFAGQIIAIIQGKYYQKDGRIFGKKFL